MTIRPKADIQVVTDGQPQGFEEGWPRPAFWLTVGTAVAFGLLFSFLEFRSGFIGRWTEIDDGVYFGEGVLLAHGILPYRSYLDLQPPGIVILMAPFGLLGRLIGDRLAFEFARLFVVVVAVANIGLLGRLVRRRHWLGVFTALAVLAFYLDTIISTHTVLLEPFLVLGTLLGFLIVFDDSEHATRSSSRWLVAGVVLGLTATIKIWEVIPLIVLLCFSSVRGRKCLANYCVGAIGAVVVICAPFYFFAPGKFFHEVVVVQATRSRLDQVAEKFRFWNLLGLPGSGHIPLRAIVWIPVALCIIILVAYFLFADARRNPSRSLATNLDVCAITCLIAIVFSFVATAGYYTHYGGFLAPFLALVLSAMSVRLLAVARPALKICFALALVLYFGWSDHAFVESKYPRVPVAVIDSAFSPSSCVLSQTYAPLILAGRYNLYEGSCPHALDIFGTELMDGSGAANVASDARAPRLQADWLTWVRRAKGFILLTPESKDANLGAAVRAYFELHYSLTSHMDGLYIYQRR
jgi:hypothetical protein